MYDFINECTIHSEEIVNFHILKILRQLISWIFKRKLEIRKCLYLKFSLKNIVLKSPVITKCIPESFYSKKCCTKRSSLQEDSTIFKQHEVTKIAKFLTCITQLVNVSFSTPKKL